MSLATTLPSSMLAKASAARSAVNGEEVSGKVIMATCSYAFRYRHACNPHKVGQHRMTMFGGEVAFRRDARRVIDDFGPVGQGGHVFYFGHGISRFTDPEAVGILVDEVHSYSRRHHSV